MQTFYYTKASLIKFSTELTTHHNTLDSAFAGINKYILYSDANLTQPVGQVLYTATVYSLVSPTQTTAYNPYVVTLFFDDGKNLSASGAHSDSPNQFFPIGKKEQATVTDQTGFKQKIQYINVIALDQNLRTLTLIPFYQPNKRCGC
jgi:hypothetical protein